jgi:uncharacterized RDD family membrane protein YckC
MKHVFNTSVGTIKVNVDRGSRTITIYRFDDQGEPIAGAIENWDRVDLLDVLSRHIGVPLSEASPIARELREQDMSLGSLSERLAWERREWSGGGSLENAGIALRFVAVLLDAVIVLLPLTIVVGLMTGGGYSEHGDGYANAGVDVGANAFWLLLALGVGYYVVCEATTGMTVGKGIVGIRVVGEDGRHVTLGAALVRNLLRVVDALFFYLVGFVFAAMSPRRQRLGDRAAHTVVVRR